MNDKKPCDILVSVYVPTYNHEKYIEQALDSILLQEVDFNMEILVGEDKSTDSTRNILKAYEKKHPGKINVYYRDANMSKLVIHNSADLRHRCNGKYIIALEGDDFWTDPHKIEKQVSFLEKHPEYIAVSHKTCVVDEKSNLLDEKYPECKNVEYSFTEYLCDIMPGQLTTVLSRNFYKMDDFDTSFIDMGLTPGDRAIFFSLLCHGRIACLPDTMSCYRHINKGGSSYSANYKYNFDTRIKWQNGQLEFATKIGLRNAIDTAKAQYFLTLRKGRKKGAISLPMMIKEIRKLHLSFKSLMLIGKRDFYIATHRSKRTL